MIATKEQGLEESAPPVPAGGGVTGATRILRQAGALALVVSGATFMGQGWGHLTTFERYYSFLALIVVIAAAGVFCARRLKEDKGARTCLAIATAALTVPVSQLAALLFSALGGRTDALPAPFVFVATSLVPVVVAGVVTGGLLVPIAYAGFSALARPMAGRLTLAAVAMNAVLLIPTRDPFPVSLVLLAAFGGLFAFEWLVLRRNSRLESTEGLIVRAILAAPLLTIIVRNALYPWSTAFAGSMLLVAGLALAVLMPPYVAAKGVARVLKALGVQCILGSWVAYSVGWSAHGLFGDEVALVILLPLSLILYGVSLNSERGGRGLRVTASFWAALIVVLQLVVIGSWVSSFVCFVAGVALIAAGYLERERVPFALGAVAAVFGVAFHVHLAFDLFTAAPWVSFAVAGLLAVVGSSYVERNRVALVERAVRLKAVWKGWA